MSRRTQRGRPPALLEPGVEETFLAAISQGTPLTHAAIATGISPATFHRWMVAGEAADERARQAETDGHPDPLTTTERRYRDFREKVMRLRARVASVNIARVDKVAEGGFLLKETPLVSKDGSLVRGDDGEIIYVREYAPPDWKAAKFLLESSFPREFKRLEQIEITGEGGGAIQVEATEVVSSLASRLAAITAERRAEDAEEPEDVEVIEDEDRTEP